MGPAAPFLESMLLGLLAQCAGFATRLCGAVRGYRVLQKAPSAIKLVKSRAGTVHEWASAHFEQAYKLAELQEFGLSASYVALLPWLVVWLSAGLLVCMTSFGVGTATEPSWNNSCGQAVIPEVKFEGVDGNRASCKLLHGIWADTSLVQQFVARQLSDA